MNKSLDKDLEEMGVGPLPAVVSERHVAPMHNQWAKYRDQFAEAMEGGLYTIDALERLIAQGRAVFFPGKDAAIVAEKVIYESGPSVFQVLWAVGDLAEVLLMAPGVEAVGRAMGCTEMLIEGRKGWERTLANSGYELWSVTLRKAL